MATENGRVYLVGNVNSTDVRLVRAKTPAQARNHVVKNDFTVAVASQDDLIKYARDVEVETAGDEA